MFYATVDECIVWVEVSYGPPSNRFNMKAKVEFLALIELWLAILAHSCST